MRQGITLVAVVAVLAAGCSAGAAAVSTPAPPPTSAAAAATSAVPAVGRTVNLSVAEGKITPATVSVRKGETVTFVAKNDAAAGEVELIVGLTADVASDSGDSLKEAEEIQPGQTKSVTYTFDGPGPYAFGDQVGDHYAKGAHGDITLEP